MTALVSTLLISALAFARNAPPTDPPSALAAAASESIPPTPEQFDELAARLRALTINQAIEIRGSLVVEGRDLSTISATWTRSGAAWMLQSIKANVGPFARGDAEIVPLGDGRQLQRDRGVATRIVASSGAPYMTEAVGLLDQSLEFTLFGALRARSPRVPELTALRHAVSDDAETWTVVQDFGGYRTTVTARIVARGEARRVERVELTAEQAGPDGTLRIVSRKILRVTAWDADLPKEVESAIETKGPTGALQASPPTRVAVTARRPAQSAEDLRTQIDARRALQPGEELLIDDLGFRMRQGSAVFRVGQTTYLAPAPLLAIPTDLNALMARSKVVPPDDAERTGRR